MSIKKQLQKITILNSIYTKWKWRERRTSYGSDYPEQTFFVIRRAYCKVGLFSYVMTNMGLTDYALKKGYIPVIDMQNGRSENFAHPPFFPAFSMVLGYAEISRLCKSRCI